jgi:cobalt-zinc-cadmium efflux system outer membrane protein
MAPRAVPGGTSSCQFDEGIVMHVRGIVVAFALVAATFGDSRPVLSQTSTSADTVPRITRQEAIRLALAHNPTLEVVRQQIQQARARVRQAVALPEPSFGVAVLGQPSVLRPHTATETDISAGLTIPFPQKIRLQGLAARGDLGALDQSLALQQQQIVFQTNQAYDSLLVAQWHRRDLLESRQLSADFLKKTQARFDAGTAAKLDVIKAQVGVAQADNDLIGNERGLAAARAALNRLLGRVLGASIEPADSLSIPPAPPDFETLEQRALRIRPEIVALERQRAGARAAASLAQQFFLPDISISVSRNNIYGSPAVYSTGIGFGFPLLFWQNQRGEVAEARHRQAELAAQSRDLAAEVGQDLRNAYSSATTALRQAIFLRDELLPSARAAYKSTLASYTLGGASALEVLDAQRTLLDAQTQYAAALAAANDAMADLERASGAPLFTATGTDR